MYKTNFFGWVEGAKPPKSKYNNYKELLSERKEAKQKEKNDKAFRQLGKNSVGQSNSKGKGYDQKQRNKGGLLDAYGTIKAKARR